MGEKVETQDNTFVLEISNKTPEYKEGNEKHRKSIDKIFAVSQYMDDMDDTSTADDYVVTYSFEDNSVLGWSINIEKDGSQQHNVYFKFDQIDDYLLDLNDSFVLLSNKILSFCRCN